jgi:hypothetical protein
MVDLLSGICVSAVVVFQWVRDAHAVSLRKLSRTIVSRPVLFAVVPFSEASTVCTTLPFESGPLFNREESN